VPTVASSVQAAGKKARVSVFAMVDSPFKADALGGKV
jgi:hypothetical protein